MFNPRYGIYDVMESVAAAMGLSGHDNRLNMPLAERYAVVLVDGLGLQLLEQHADLAPFLSSMQSVTDVSSAIPSTTSVNLTSFGTGLRPGAHGMSGYSCRIPGTRRVLNTLRWDDSIDPVAWQPHPTMFERMAQSGTHVAVCNKGDFEFSGLTQSSQRGVPYVPVEHSWERNIAMSHEAGRSAPSFVFGYESSLDFAGHAHGVDSDEWREALRAIDRDLQELRESLPADTTLVVTADHGMVDIALDGRFDVVDHPDLLTDVVVLAGEARFRHIHTAAGAEHEVASRWAEALGQKAEVRLREDTQDWFGPLDSRVAPRFGDVLVAALGDFGVFHSGSYAVEMLMTGFHGSVTEVERRIPVLVAN